MVLSYYNLPHFVQKNVVVSSMLESNPFSEITQHKNNNSFVFELVVYIE
jgi:hypothetical protein